MKIVIAGYYGFENTGDEAILSAMLYGLHENYPDVKITVLSGDPAKTKSLHHVEAIHWTNIPLIVSVIRDGDLVILGGGGLFHDYWPFEPSSMLTRNHSGLAYYCGIAHLATLLKRKFAIIGVGVGPLFSPEGRDLTRYAFEQAHLITVRDDQSKKNLVELGIAKSKVHVTADLALSLPKSAIDRSSVYNLTVDPPVVGVSVREWSINVDQTEWEHRMALALDSIIEEQKLKILFIPFQTLDKPGLNDVLVAKRIARRMTHKADAYILDNKLKAAEILSILSQCDAVIAMRLHAVVFSIAVHTPFVAITYDRKVNNLVKRIGWDGQALGITNLNRDELINQVDSCLNNRVRMSKELVKASKVLQKESQANINFTLELLMCIPSQVHHRSMGEPASIRRAALAHFELIYQQQQQLEEREKVIKQVNQELEKQVTIRDKMITDLHEQQARMSDEFHNVLAEIHNSRYWKLLSLYWGLRESIRKLYQEFRNWMRRLIPYGPRRWFVRIFPNPRPKRPVKNSGKQRLAAEGKFVSIADGIASPIKYDLICFPIINWEFRYQRPQQLIAQFADDGHRCFFVRNAFQQEKELYSLDQFQKNICEIHLSDTYDHCVYTDELPMESIQQFLDAFSDLRRKEDIIEAVCLVQLPFWKSVAEAMREKFGWKIVYDCMDEHAGFSSNSKKMLQQEQALISSSDLVLASSYALVEKCSQYNDNVVYLPNAADFKHFNSPPRKKPLENFSKPIIGYFGAISEWFDPELIQRSANMHPDWQFVLIGDTFGFHSQRLSSLSNVHLLGERPYQQIPGYLHDFDVACIPFKITALTRATNPVKFYEYLCAGKPVVSTDLPELQLYADYYYAASTPEAFEDQISKALEEQSPELVKKRIEFARQHTWEHRYADMRGAITNAFGKAVIVILSCDNLEYIKICLESIGQKTLYPNYEVIVVDNGSAFDVLEYLEGESKDNHKFKVIYNNENLGFAQANNIGIDAAGDCEYIVLLNDDTVVTRGWLSKLIKHIQSPDVELVGPVSNWAGNEARIETNYKDMDGMERFAEKYCRLHDGQSFDIPMLAMYCVVMRKSLIERIGYLDERFGIGMFEDDDFSFRVRLAGGKVICAEDVFIHHWGQATLGRLQQVEYDQLFEKNKTLYEEKWGRKWKPHRHR